MERLPKQVYTAEFQAESVKLVLEGGLSLTSVRAKRRLIQANRTLKPVAKIHDE